MTDPATLLATLAESPDWFCHQLDLEADRALLLRLEPAAIRAAAFLDERVLAGRSDGFRIPLATLRERAQACVGRAPHAIFHIGHCGSTLLARVLGELPGLRVLREPLPLRTLAALYEELPQATARYRRAFGDDVAIIHSRLTGPDRFDIWERIEKGEHRIVVGPRSAVFSPVKDLRLIIVDEEQDESYKQDDKPRYHARSVALVRGRDRIRWRTHGVDLKTVATERHFCGEPDGL